MVEVNALTLSTSIGWWGIAGYGYMPTKRIKSLAFRNSKEYIYV